MTSAIIDCFYRVLHDAKVPTEHRQAVSFALLRHVLRLAPYRDNRKSLREVIPSDVERRVYEKMQKIKQTYEAHVMLWRALCCFIETQDINKAAYLHGLTTADIEWVLRVFEHSDELGRLPDVSPAHWSTKPISKDEVAGIVQHRKIQALINKYIQFCHSGVIWAFDDANSQQDLKADLEYKVIATVQNYEAKRRSRWHLINGAAIAIENEINNRTRKSTSVESGGVVEDKDIKRKKGAEDDDTDVDIDTSVDTKKNRREHGATIQRMVPIVGTNDDGSEYDLGEAVADSSFYGMRKVIDTINEMRHLIRPHVYEYLRVVVLRDPHEEFDRMIAEMEATSSRELSEHTVMKHARKFFRLSVEDMKIMQGAISG